MIKELDEGLKENTQTGGKKDGKYRKECKRHRKKYEKILTYKYQQPENVRENETDDG